MSREKTLARRERAELEQYEPWNTFREMERMFRDFFTSPLPLLQAKRMMMPEGRFEVMPEVDLRETENELIMSAVLPGLDKDDIKINVTDDSITICGERKEEEETPGEVYHVRQQSHGAFRVCYDLPREVVPDDVKATYEKGILEVHMPKAEITEEHKVQIEVKD